MNDSYKVEQDELFITSMVNSLYDFILSIPFSQMVIQYMKSSYQDDPFRIVLELFLVFFVLKYMLSKKYKPHENNITLTDKEVDELIEEWEPEPLVPKLNKFDQMNLNKTTQIIGPQGSKVKIVGHSKLLMNLATTNYLNFVTSEHIRQKAIDTLKEYGVGTCGPPGFYGTLDIHMKLERDIADFLGTDDAIIYAQGFSTISSVIPAFSKRGDLLVVDDGVNFGIQKGVQISRSNVRWFKHNDMNDLKRVLNDIYTEDMIHKKRVTRRFIITEGVSANEGDIAPLDRLIELKKKYKYRLILDESQSIGVIGKRGAGLCDLFNIPPSEVDMIVGSLSTTICSSGGFCAGSIEMVDHQRLSGIGYCFSASIPALLAASAIEAIHLIEQQSSFLLNELHERCQSFQHILFDHKLMDTMIEIHHSSSSSSSSHHPHYLVPFFHLRIKPHYLKSKLLFNHRHQHHLYEKEQKNNNKKRKANGKNSKNDDIIDMISREQEENILQDIVDECISQGVLITRTKYVYDQEKNCPRPSIKVHITIGLSKKENDKAGSIVRSAIIKVFNKWRK